MRTEPQKKSFLEKLDDAYWNLNRKLSDEEGLFQGGMYQEPFGRVKDFLGGGHFFTGRNVNPLLLGWEAASKYRHTAGPASNKVFFDVDYITTH